MRDPPPRADMQPFSRRRVCLRVLDATEAFCAGGHSQHYHAFHRMGLIIAQGIFQVGQISLHLLKLLRTNERAKLRGDNV